jgi:hypothetical protein
VRISDDKINELRILLKEQTGRDFTAEEAQVAGLAIVRFVMAKHRLPIKDNDEQGIRDSKHPAGRHSRK